MSEFSPDLRYRDDAIRRETVRQVVRFVRGLIVVGSQRGRPGVIRRAVLETIRAVADQVERNWFPPEARNVAPPATDDEQMLAWTRQHEPFAAETAALVDELLRDADRARGAAAGDPPHPEA